LLKHEVKDDCRQIRDTSKRKKKKEEGAPFTDLTAEKRGGRKRILFMMGNTTSFNYRK